MGNPISPVIGGITDTGNLPSLIQPPASSAGMLSGLEGLASSFAGDAASILGAINGPQTLTPGSFYPSTTGGVVQTTPVSTTSLSSSNIFTWLLIAGVVLLAGAAIFHFAKKK